MKYLEDFEVGQTCELGAHTVTREEILDFARTWDPQRFHVDPEAARDTPFGGLIASGWHTVAIFMRLYVTALLVDSHGGAVPASTNCAGPNPCAPVTPSPPVSPWRRSPPRWAAATEAPSNHAAN